MQTYQQYLTLPLQHQLPPQATAAYQRQVPVLGQGEARVGGASRNCELPAPGYISINPPTSYVYRIQPGNFAYGFNSSGKLVGANQEIPYPFPNTMVHNINFPRAVEWSAMGEIPGITMEEVMKRRQACHKTELPTLETETPEYFTAANDEGYRKWVAKKFQEEKEQNAKQEKMRTVPPEIKAMPGHVNPSIKETANEAYGQYLDLLPKYPAVYPLPAKNPPTPMQILVKFKRSNISDHPKIPDHSFAIDPVEMINKDGCYTRGIHGSVYYPEVPGRQRKTAFTFRQNEVILGQTVGERKKGFTWPLYSPTGLEINRPISQCVSVVIGADGKKKFRTLVPARSVPYIYNRYMSCATIPGNDPEAEVNPAYLQQKQICAPCTARPPTDPRCDPCSLKFINPQILPVPTEIRKQSPC